MRQVFGIGMLLPAVLLVASGCATKNWVRDMVGKKEAEIDQRVERRVVEEGQRLDSRVAAVDKRVGDEAQRVEGMGFRVSGLESGLKETTTLAAGARERADQAFARAEDTDARFTRVWSNRHKRDVVETVEVRFGFDKWDLSDAAQTSLVALVKELRENPKLTVDLQGYADPKGTYDYNVGLSQRRVEAVRRFLVEKGIELPRINFVGLGPIMEKGIPDEQKRRVTLRLMTPSE